MLKWLFLGLTLINLIAILKSRINKKSVLNKYVHRQSTVHQVAKLILPKNSELLSKKPTQYKNYIKNKTIRVITAPDGNAYWVKDNKFYCAEYDNSGEFDPTQAKEIDAGSLSKKEINKLLLILDNLNRGISNDRGNSGH